MAIGALVGAQGAAAAPSYTIAEIPTGVPQGAVAYPISDFILTEATAGTVGAGQYVLEPSVSQLPPPASSPGSFAGTTTVTAKGLTIAAAPSAGPCPTSGGTSTLQIAPNSMGQYALCVVTPSTSGTGPGGLKFSNLTFTPPAAAGPVQVVLADQSTLDTTTYTASQPAITVVYNPRIAGTTADLTSEAAATSLYPSGPMNNGQGGAAIIASDAGFQDALSASFLGNTALTYQTISGSGATSGTGTMTSPVPILLNPPTPPSGGEASTAAADAIKKLGVSTVYLIGGTQALSSDVQAQLSAIQISSSGSIPQDLQVVRIAGTTAEGTAAAVAGTPVLTGNQGTLPATPGAYGRYNSGASESTAPSATGRIPTAILADADEFQDALASSPLAYSDSLPVLLTPGGQTLDSNATSAIQKLKISQVVIVGGDAAVSPSVVTQLEAMKVSVLRIAGTTFDGTAGLLAAFELNDYTPQQSGQTQAVEGLNSAATEDGGPGLSVGTSRGDDFPDALSASQVLGATVGDISPLLLNSGVGSISPATANLLSSAGTAPGGGLVVYTVSNGQSSSTTEHILGDIVFGGTGAQTPALVVTELDTIAGG